MSDENMVKLQEKMDNAKLTEEEVALFFYQEMKKRIMDYIPAVFGPIVSSMVDSNANTLEFDINYENLGKHAKITIITSDMQS